MAKKVSDVIQIVQSAIVRTRSLSVPRPAPSVFYYPGLSSKPCYPSNSFGFESILRENHKIIADEYLRLRQNSKNDYDVGGDQLHHGHWDWNSYILKGKRNTDFAVQCPKTVEILESFDKPALMANTPFSFAFFSTLGPQSSIQSHFGPCNLRLRCHLPLIVPKGDCALRVGNDVIEWKVGEPVVFDDSYQHEVWNKTDQERVVLLFDVWHPELHSDEVMAVMELFRSAQTKGWLK